MLKIDELKNSLETAKADAQEFINAGDVVSAKAKMQEINDLKEAIKVQEELDKDIEDKRGLEAMTNIYKVTDEEKNFIENLKNGRFMNVSSTGVTAGDNSGLIPNTIADKVIAKVNELSPIFAKATKFYVGGDLTFIKESTTASFNYTAEETEATVNVPTFGTVKLASFMANTVVKISKSLINRTDIDAVNYIVNQLANAAVSFLEKELINGTTNYAEGVIATTNTITTAAVKTIAADELIATQLKVKSALQANACWIMSTNNFLACRKLKDAQNNYLLGNLENGGEYKLLGKPVYLSDNIDDKTIVYGDLSGLYVKFSQDIKVTILNEVYATKHMVGVLAEVEFDSKIVESDKIAKLSIKQA